MAASTESVLRALAGDFLAAHPDEAAPLLEEWPAPELAALLAAEPLSLAAGVLDHLTLDAASQAVEALDASLAAALLTRADPSRAAAVLSRVPEPSREACLAHAPTVFASEVRELMAYPADSAGGLMDVHVTTVRPETPAGQALARVRTNTVGRGGVLVLVDEAGRLAGLVRIEDAALADPARQVGELARGPAPSLQALASREEVVDLFAQLGLSSLPVVDAEGRVVGLIRHSALIRAAEEEASADIQTMVGASAEERALSPIGFAVRKRLPWLQINLVTAFLAAAVVGLFEETIATYTALAVLLPVVAGQSGNTGAQALAVTMRGLVLREIRLRHSTRVLYKEGMVALLNGIGVATTTSVAVFVWSRSFGLAAVIGLSMVISMVCAGLSGAAVPIALVAARQDPAQSSSIILTTITDVVGFFSFLGIATVLAAQL